MTDEDRIKLNDLWFEVMAEYCKDAYTSVNSPIKSQINILGFKNFEIGVILPFEDTHFFRYCSLSTSIDNINFLRKKMAIVPNADGVKDDMPAAIGIHSAIMCPTPVAWAPYQTEKPQVNGIRDIDSKVAIAEKEIFNKSEKGLYLLPIVYGYFPYIIFLISSNKSLDEYYDFRFLRNMLELISQSAKEILKKEFANKILLPFALKVHNRTNGLNGLLRSACDDLITKTGRKNIFSSWTISLPGHFIDEIRAQQEEAQHSSTIIQDVLLSFHANVPQNVVKVFMLLLGHEDLKKLFENPHSPWQLETENIGQKKVSLKAKNLSYISKHISKLIEEFLLFEDGDDINKYQIIYSKLKAYLWPKSRGDSTYLMPLGLLCDWPLIVDKQPWESIRVVCGLNNCTLSVKSCDDVGSNSLICHYSDTRFSLKENPYVWIETLRAFNEELRGKVTINIEISGQNCNDYSAKTRITVSGNFDSLDFESERINIGYLQGLYLTLKNGICNGDDVSVRSNKIEICLKGPRC